ncbi:hypothetical protein ACIA8C_04345 [Nocardia sp. NPDC051321]|uniref:hypothetical protein n=1 Tax=Nocardia sp. NPDC051321 TaxID=3364323 RepID=UPI00378E4840
MARSSSPTMAIALPVATHAGLPPDPLDAEPVPTSPPADPLHAEPESGIPGSPIPRPRSR